LAKSLKEQNRWQIWLIIALNSLLLYGATAATATKFADLCSTLPDTGKLVPFGLAVVVATVMNGLLDPNTTKARLVFLRWRDPLPGSRAFSKYVTADPRIDPAKVETAVGSPLPIEPVQQNRTWFRLYKAVENDPAVLQVHRDFLLTRDYTSLATLFLVIYGTASVFVVPSTKILLIYLLFLVLQYIMARQAASRYGVRMVTTVLARATAKLA
jgi:hypothetical protein